MTTTSITHERPGYRRSPYCGTFVLAEPVLGRVIGGIRRDCLDHVIVLKERHLHRILGEYFDYYHNSRRHLSLARNAPVPRNVEPPSAGDVVAIPQVDGLHHRHASQAA